MSYLRSGTTTSEGRGKCGEINEFATVYKIQELKIGKEKKKTERNKVERNREVDSQLNRK